MRKSRAELLLSKIEFGACWRWRASRNAKGYGIVRYGGRSELAHRAVWMELYGPVPEGMTLDHGCPHKDCVRPLHLEPVTAAENSRRAHTTDACAGGHPWAEETTLVRPNGGRVCRICRRARERQRNSELRAVQAAA